ncbi:MAG: Transcriptional regulator, AraC family [Parcubacteria group bacterium GW2011_GWA2_47_16]|nr:MAG: Transcriptional regulator, AraC family [Parcubacteria group bacterium GW2011_GWA2_47_16]
MQKTILEVDTGGVVERAKQFVREHINEDLNAFRVSNKIGVHKVLTFLRLFEETTGKRFADFVKDARVEKARGLVLNPHYTEAEISLAVGFNNVSTFRRSFKKIHGESPTSYRKRIPPNLQRPD